MEVYVPLAGGTLRTEDTGGDGTPVVFIHADWTDSGTWDPLLPLLRDRHRVIRYDLRGFGRSSRPEQSFTRLGDLEYPMVSQASRAIAAALDGCREILVPGADHLLPLRDPLRLAQAVTEVAG